MRHKTVLQEAFVSTPCGPQKQLGDLDGERDVCVCVFRERETQILHESNTHTPRRTHDGVREQESKDSELHEAKTKLHSIKVCPASHVHPPPHTRIVWDTRSCLSHVQPRPHTCAEEL